MNEKMLIIDDQEINHEIIVGILKDQFEFIHAFSGEEGISELHKTDINIILLDLYMSGMDGFDFIEKIKNTESSGNVPIVVITSSENVNDQVRAFRLGAKEFITKPFNADVVRVRIENVMQHYRQMRMVRHDVEVLKVKNQLDAMTGLYNKESMECLSEEILCKSQGCMNVMIAVDIDNFKTVNDSLGHQVGDRVIKTIADLILRMVRKTDYVGRIGGDEFCILMLNVPNMKIIHKKLREICQLMKYKPNLAIPEYVSLSMGVATNESRNTSYAELFSRADDALNYAKENGKAQYFIYGTSLSEPQDDGQYEKKKATESEKEYAILIVDDDAITRRILKNMMDDHYEILEAENGVEAMKMVHSNEERLVAILLDLYMPIMDGYQVLEQMKRGTNRKYIPVIICTADSTEEAEVRTLTLGANVVIHKPFNGTVITKHLNNMISAYIDRKRGMKQQLLQKTLMGSRTNTFLCTYHYETNRVEIGDNYLKYVCEDFPDLFKCYPFQYQRFVLPADYARMEQFLDIENGKKEYDEIEVKIRVNNTGYEWFEISKVVQRNELHKVESAIFMFQNIQYAMDTKQNLVFMATNDTLTHIPNMRTFSSNVSEMLNDYPNEEFVMITMDIFQFRLVNKLFGNKEGDNILKYTATKLQELVEDLEKGVYCRASSDIFYACISAEENIGEFMQTMQRSLFEYILKFQIKLCFGIYRIKDHTENVESMIDHSAFARKRTKEAPITTFYYYDDEMLKKETFETVAISEMDDAMSTKQFEVYYQPKCDIETGSIIGAEALIRWNHPKEGYLSPAYFIPIFEQNGTCIELDYYVYKEVCAAIRQRLDENLPVVPVSVNVSRWSLYNENLEEHILSIVDRYRVPHQYIEFEITESAFVLESGLLTKFSTDLREKGFKVLIDDFGSGYSSLNSLKDISVDILKIDIKFLPVSENEKKAEIVLASVIQMGKKLGLGIIAEGVETKEQVKVLKDLGCRCVQGYYFFKPMPYLEFQRKLDGNA